MKACKDFKKSYQKQEKYNLKRDSTDSFIYENPLPSSSSSEAEEEKDVKCRGTVEDLWTCQRIDKNNKKKTPAEIQLLQNIPLGEEEQKRWINARKEDQHLELDFLPTNLVYGYAGNLVDSKNMLEEAISQIG